MPFHMNNLGSFGANLYQWADLDGYVPQEGDTPDQFSYEDGDFDPDEWRIWVEQAVTATKRAEEALERWRTA